MLIKQLQIEISVMKENIRRTNAQCLEGGYLEGLVREVGSGRIVQG